MDSWTYCQPCDRPLAPRESAAGEVSGLECRSCGATQAGDDPAAEVIEGLFAATMGLASARGFVHDQPDRAVQRIEAAIHAIDEAMVTLRHAAGGDVDPAVWEWVRQPAGTRGPGHPRRRSDGRSDAGSTAAAREPRRRERD